MSSDVIDSNVPLRVADGPSPELNGLLDTVPLVDHHTHSIVGGRVDAAAYVFMLDETDRPAAAALAGLDTQVGFAVRRWCAPLLGMSAGEPAESFLSVRLAMRNEEAAARLLPAAGFGRVILETGYRGDELVGVEEVGRLATAPVATVARLETIAETVALAGTSADAFATSVVDAVESAIRAGAVGLKSIVAYRHGLDIDPTRPSKAEVAAAAGPWLAEVDSSRRARIDDPVLLRFLLWTAVDTGRPLQVHAGYGDPDLDLARSDPLLLTDFIRATEGLAPILLLHNYPFHRHAGYLAQMFPHVWIDVGLGVNYTGAQSPQVIAESLELAPFAKILFSSDAWGLPELHLLGAVLWRRGMSRIVGEWVARGDWSLEDAERVVRMIASGNANRVYGLDARGRDLKGLDAAASTG